MSRSRSLDFSLVNMHAMQIYHEENNGSDPQETRCQVLVFLNCNTAVSIRFLERRISVLKVERLVSVLRVQCPVSCGLESLKKWNVSVSSWSLRLTVSVSSRSCDLTSCGHPWLKGTCRLCGLWSPVERAEALMSCVVYVYIRLVNMDL